MLTVLPPLTRPICCAVRLGWARKLIPAGVTTPWLPVMARAVTKPNPSTVPAAGVGEGPGSGKPTAARETFTGRYPLRGSPATIMMVPAGTRAITLAVWLASVRRVISPELTWGRPRPSGTAEANAQPSTYGPAGV